MVALPEEFVRKMERLGFSGLPAALTGTEPSVSIRMNRSKPQPMLPEGAEAVEWCAEGRYLPERPVFTLDPALHQGRYYVQEAGSMFVGWIVRHLTEGSAEPLRVLDACAAPGGKTTAVIDALPEGSLVVANEYVPARAAVLRENIIKWGSPYTIVTRGDTERLSRLRGMFDLVIADVPCSGEGMMRKDSEAVAQWSQGLVEECAARQKEIVANLWETLRPGGVMIYSTCTFSREEDEDVVRWILESFSAVPVSFPAPPATGIRVGEGIYRSCFRFIVGEIRGEGLFVSAVRKLGDGPRREPGTKKKAKPARIPAQFKDVLNVLDCPAGFQLRMTDDRLTAFPLAHADMLDAVAAVTDVIHEGIPLGNIKGRDLIPSHALAMSTALAPGAFPKVDLDRQAALKYLHGDAPVLPDGTPRGYVLLTYENTPLGFVKNLGNRCNSLYPAGWRIKMNIE